MSFAEISKALCDRVDTMGTVWATQRPNQEIKTDNLTEWQKLNVVNAKTETFCVGPNGLERWDGFLQVLVFVEAGNGDADSGARADAIKAHFPRALCLTENSTTIAISDVHIGKPYDDPVDPKWWVTPVTIFYYAIQ